MQYEWEQHALTAWRVYERDYPIRPSGIETVRVHRAGVAVLRTGFVGDVGPMTEQFEQLVTRDELRVALRRLFDAGRELLLELGAHGDLRLAVRLEGHHRVMWSPHESSGRSSVVVELWTSLDLSSQRVDDTIARIEEEIGRALGFAPQF